MFPGEKGPGGGGARWGDARGHVRLSLPPGGGVRRLRRGKRACSPMGRSIASGGDPKGCRGRAESPLLFCRNIYTPWGFSPTTARRFPKGNEGKRVPSGHNRRRRLATRSSGKQQAGRTAVRTAPIVCPEESPLVRPQVHTPTPLARRLPEGGAGGRAESPLLATIGDNVAVSNSPLRGIDAPTPAREQGLQPHWALYCFEWRSEGVQGGTKESGYPVDTTAEGG